ncbi:unnamed protein product [Brassica oleracea var. botrytis]
MVTLKIKRNPVCALASLTAYLSSFSIISWKPLV